MAEGAKMPIDPGIIARVVAGVRYVVTGQQPDWFGPGQPLTPVAQEQAKGRQFDFPFAWNTRIAPPRADEAISFQQMRALADSLDILRLMIETRKDQICGQAWQIKPKAEGEKPNRQCKAITAFLAYPDQEHTWGTWLRMLVEDVLVIDAPAIYPRATMGGGMFALEPVDGATIKRVLDATGRTPLPPDPAYQQILKGLPAVDYSRDELVYWPRNPRTHKIYGYSPVEQIIVTVNIALRRQAHQLQYYTEGNVPEALASVPKEWSVQQIREFQEYWDALLEGDTARRRHLKFIPDGLKYQPTKDAALKDEFDEWLARIVCFAFSVEPTPFIKQQTRTTADTAREQSIAEGLAPLKRWIKELMDYIIAKYWQSPELEFSWIDEKAIAPKDKAAIDKIYVDAGILHPDEVRAELGLPPLTEEQRKTMRQSKSASQQPGGTNNTEAES